MKCKVFTENIEKYIAGEVSKEFREEIEEHLLQCPDCNELYNEELFIKSAILDTLKLDEIPFESQKDKILNKIDKNKYKNLQVKESKFYLSEFLKYFRVGMPIAAAIAFIVFINPIDKFKVFENKTGVNIEDKSISQKNEKASENNLIVNKDKADEKLNDDLKLDTKNTLQNNIEELSEKTKSENNSFIDKDEKLKESSVAGNNKNQERSEEENLQEEKDLTEENMTALETDEVETGDKEDSNNKIAGEIDSNEDLTGQEKDIEEKVEANGSNETINGFYYEIENDKMIKFDKKLYGDNLMASLANNWTDSPNKQFKSSITTNNDNLSRIYIKDVNRNLIWSMEKEFAYGKSVPKHIEWYDEENLFVIMNEVSEDIKKEELYLVNINKGNATMLYRAYGGNRSIVGINKINTRNVELKIQFTNNDNIVGDSMQSFTVLDIKKNMLSE